ncbi:MAG: Plasmid stabilization system protein [Mucilaginibacter sp.]|nr:Plasmid stabilization system protein [Mucilaginibacter sp.]
MSYIVKYYPKAEIEYLEAFNWYEKELAGLGDRFESCVEKSISSIISKPLIYPNKKYNCRVCNVKDFPYIIVYKVYPKKALILIVSIFHTSRNPKSKYSP